MSIRMAELLIPTPMDLVVVEESVDTHAVEFVVENLEFPAINEDQPKADFTRIGQNLERTLGSVPPLFSTDIAPTDDIEKPASPTMDGAFIPLPAPGDHVARTRLNVEDSDAPHNTPHAGHTLPLEIPLTTTDPQTENREPLTPNLKITKTAINTSTELPIENTIHRSTMPQPDAPKHVPVPEPVEALRDPKPSAPSRPTVDTTVELSRQNHTQQPDTLALPVEKKPEVPTSKTDFGKVEFGTTNPATISPGIALSPIKKTQSTGQPPVRDISAQISAAVKTSAGDTIELRLDPPELGRVRISISSSEGALSATISTEKPEISDFLRRHTDVLAREFSKSGFDGATFKFTQDDHSADQQNGEWTAGFADEPGDDILPESATLRPSQDGLDIRL